MIKMRFAALLAYTVFVTVVSQSNAQANKHLSRNTENLPHMHNVVLFITDGLRHVSVNSKDAPNIYSLREKGVNFVNSHSVFPTVTTANASAFATGHGLGDTGNFTNELYVDAKDAEETKHCNQGSRPLTFDMEDNVNLAVLNCLNHGNYMGVSDTLISLARKKGYSTAVIGKLGPTAIQDISEVALSRDNPPVLKEPSTVIIDGAIGKQDGFPIPRQIRERMQNADLKLIAPDASDGTSPNILQQKYFTDVVVKALLPEFNEELKEHQKPFFLIFWSADPDRTQHSQKDYKDDPGKLDPGINGETSKAAIRNADDDLGQILDSLKQLGLLDSTDVLIAADHGFSTISKGALAGDGVPKVTSYAAGLVSDATIAKGALPPGFLPIDLAHDLEKDAQLYDLEPDQVYPLPTFPVYPRVDAKSKAKYPGSTLIGGSGKANHLGKTDAEVITVPSGNSELIYLPQADKGKNKSLAAKICGFLTHQSYIDGVFVADALGTYPGTLPLSSIGLWRGSAKSPVPAILVNFKGFPLDVKRPWYTWVQIADTGLAQGQGMHGGLDRADTFNNIVAFGPDFREGFVDDLPVSNADVAQTIAYILGLKLPIQESDKARGRVLKEALRNEGDYPVVCTSEVKSSKPTDKGARTVLHFQKLIDKTDGRQYAYYDQACLVVTSDNGDAKCKYSSTEAVAENAQSQHQCGQ